MNPKNFLQWGGIVMVVIGLLGVFVSAMAVSASVAWTYLVVGVIALLLGYTSVGGDVQKWVSVVIGVVGVLLGLYGFVSPGLLGASQEAVYNILNLVIGIWGLWAGFAKGQTSMMS